MLNLTGVPQIFDDLNLAGSTMTQLSETERMARKKKLLAAGQSSSFTDAISTMFGTQLNSAGSPRA